jgi:hypothetical protein
VANNCTLPTNPCNTVQHAVNQASPLGTDTLYLSTHIYQNMITGTLSGGAVVTQTLFLNKPITVTGGYDLADGYTTYDPLNHPTRISGQDVRRSVYVTEGITVTLQGLLISNGAEENGAGIYNAGANLTLRGVIVENNIASGNGGGLYHNAGSLQVYSSVWQNNTAVVGAGLYLEEATASLDNNTFLFNDALTSGGGFFHNNGTLNLRNNIFSQNSGTPDAFQVAPSVAVLGAWGEPLPRRQRQPAVATNRY